MTEEQSMGFFVISVMLLVSITVTCGVSYAINHFKKKALEEKELKEAAKMFEQRIALRPKHMGARLGMGVAGDVHFETSNDRKE